MVRRGWHHAHPCCNYSNLTGNLNKEPVSLEKLLSSCFVKASVVSPNNCAIRRDTEPVSLSILKSWMQAPREEPLRGENSAILLLPAWAVSLRWIWYWLLASVLEICRPIGESDEDSCERCCDLGTEEAAYEMHGLGGLYKEAQCRAVRFPRVQIPLGPGLRASISHSDGDSGLYLIHSLMV